MLFNLIIFKISGKIHSPTGSDILVQMMRIVDGNTSVLYKSEPLERGESNITQSYNLLMKVINTIICFAGKT